MNDFTVLFEQRPTPQNRLAPLCALTGVTAAIVLLLAAGQAPAYASLLQGGAILSLVLCVYMISRWRIHYIYRLCEEPDGVTLSVALLRGGKERTLCRLLLSDLCASHVITPDNRRAQLAAYRGDLIHTYCPELSPARSVLLAVCEGEGRVIARLSASDALVAQLRKYSNC